MSAYFITGTDTEIGKTVVTSTLLAAASQQGLRCAGLKPIASGCEMTPNGLRNEDALALMAQASVELPYEVVNPFAFEPAIAPHIAAEQSGTVISVDKIQQSLTVARQQTELVLVEGVGGWKVPLGEGLDVAGLAKALGLPVILVVGMRLGCINHALLSVESILASGQTLGGWVANQVSPQMACFDENLATLQESIKAPLLGVLPYQEQPDPGALAQHLTQFPV